MINIKKVTTLVLSILLIFGLFSISLSAATYGKYDFFSYKIDNEIVDFKFHHVTKHLSRCIFAMINIQGLNYGKFDSLIYNAYQHNGETLEKILSKSLKE